VQGPAEPAHHAAPVAPPVHASVAPPTQPARAAAPKKIEMDIPSVEAPANPIVQAVHDEAKEKEEEASKPAR
jgi:hypothetical protein